MATTGQDRGTPRSRSSGDSPGHPAGAPLTLRDAAERCGVTLKALRRRVERGTLEVARVERDGQVLVVVELDALERAGLLPGASPGRGTPTPPGQLEERRAGERGTPGQGGGAALEQRLRERLAALAARHGALGREAGRLREQLEQERRERVQLANLVGVLEGRLGRDALEQLPAHEEPAARRWGRGARTVALGLVVVAAVALGSLGWRTAREADVQLSRAEAVAQRAGRELGEAQALRAGAGEALSAALQERQEAERLAAQVEVERQLQRQARVVFEAERQVLRLVEQVVLGRR